VSSFHTAVILHAARRTASSKKRNIERTHQRRTTENEKRPSVVLGTTAQTEVENWSKCDLARCLVNPHNLNGPPALPLSAATEPYSLATLPGKLTEMMSFSESNFQIVIPKDTNYGMGTPDKQMLFQEFPYLCATSAAAVSDSQSKAKSDKTSSPKGSEKNSLLPEESEIASLSPTGEAERVNERVSKVLNKEKKTLEALAKVIDLVNANAKCITYENRRRIVLEFSRPENPFDPGRVEVQGEVGLLPLLSLFK